MMFLFEERYLERQDGEQLIHIAFDVLDAVFLPSPDLWRDIIEEFSHLGGIVRWLISHFSEIFGNLKIEAGIVNKDHGIGLPLHDILLAQCHISENGAQMEQYWNEAHIGQFLIMFHTGASHGGHQVTTEEPERCFRILFLQRPHQMRSMEVAACLAYYQVVFHLVDS